MATGACEACGCLGGGGGPPLVVLLKGQPGSGKSTLARALATRLRVPLIDKDDARSACQRLTAAHPGVDWNELSYGVMWRHVDTQLACGLSLVVDCPMARRSLFDAAASLAARVRRRRVRCGVPHHVCGSCPSLARQRGCGNRLLATRPPLLQHGAQLALVELEPRDAQLWRQRVEQRGQLDRGTEHEHKPGSWADVQAVLARNGGSEDWSAAADVHVAARCRLDSTASNTEQMMHRVLDVLQQRPGSTTSCTQCQQGRGAAAAPAQV